MSIFSILAPVVGGIGSLLGGIKGASSANAAAATQAHWGQAVGDAISRATKQAQDAMNTAVPQANTKLQEGYDRIAGNLTPWLSAGTQGVTSLSDMMKPGGYLTEQFKAPTAEEAAATPGYQFTRDQGMKALAQSAASRGMLNSGGAAKALAGYTTGLADQTYNDVFNRGLTTFQTNRNNMMNSLGALMNAGQFGTSQFNQANQNLVSGQAGNLIGGAQYAGDIGLRGTGMAGDAYLGGANAKAAGQLASGQAWQNAISGMANNAISGITLGQAMKPQVVPTANTSGFWNMPTSGQGYSLGNFIAPMPTGYISPSMSNPYDSFGW